MAELNSVLADATVTRSVGGVPVAIKNRFYRWSPAEFHANAIARDSAPSGAIITQTRNAILDMFDSGELCQFDAGTYYIDGTINPVNFNVSATRKNSIEFNDTTIRAAGNLADYYKATDQGSGAIIDSGTSPSGDNNIIPASEEVPVMFDVTNCEYFEYRGSLTLHGGSKDLAILACANAGVQAGTARINAAGGTGSTWGTLILTNGRWGIFGTPRYGQARNYYNGVFVGNILNRLRIYDCTFPILAGGNTIDDCFIGEYNQIGKTTAGIGSRILTCAFTMGTGYMNGATTSDYGVWLENSHMIFKTMYAEENFAAPIRLHAASWVEGTCKYGAGANTVFGKKAFIYSDQASSGGIITAHERSASAESGASMVKLKAVASSKRNFMVYSPHTDAACTPFTVESGSGIATTDKLVAFTRDGMKKWTMAGTAGAPTISATSTIV